MARTSVFQELHTALTLHIQIVGSSYRGENFFYSSDNPVLLVIYVQHTYIDEDNVP